MDYYDVFDNISIGLEEALDKYFNHKISGFLFLIGFIFFIIFILILVISLNNSERNKNIKKLNVTNNQQAFLINKLEKKIDEQQKQLNMFILENFKKS